MNSSAKTQKIPVDPMLLALSDSRDFDSLSGRATFADDVRERVCVGRIWLSGLAFRGLVSEGEAALE